MLNDVFEVGSTAIFKWQVVILLTDIILFSIYMPVVNSLLLVYKFSIQKVLDVMPTTAANIQNKSN